MAHSMDDEIDPETLQAQIDLSMSFAHNLVTSWIQTTHAAQPHPGISDTERILEEELRRPPRLGVGAPLPVANFTSRDAAKLRHRLAKTGDKALTSSEKPLQLDHKSDEDEEKGKPVKRAKRNDPFTMPGLKKRKKVDDAWNKLSTPEPDHPANGIKPRDNDQATQNALTEKIFTEQSIHGITLATSVIATSGPSPTPQSSLLRSDPTPSRGCAEGGGKSSAPIPATAIRSTGTSGVTHTIHSPYSSHETPWDSGSDAHEITNHATTPWSGNCPTPSPVSVQHSVSSKHDGLSLLNLDGPVGNSTTPNISRKQRRRRKKKKIIMTGTGTGAT